MAASSAMMVLVDSWIDCAAGRPEIIPETILGKDYVHLPELAPTREILKAYRDSQGDWVRFERDSLA